MWLRGPLNILRGHTESIFGICINPQGNVICSASEDKTMRTWDARSGHHLQTFTGHTSHLNCVVATSNGVAITGSGDRILKKWILDTATCVGTFSNLVKVSMIKASSCDWDTVKLNLIPYEIVLTNTEESILVGVHRGNTRKSIEITIQDMKTSREFNGRYLTLTADNQMLFTSTNDRKDIGIYNVSHLPLIYCMKSECSIEFVPGKLTKTIKYGTNIYKMVASHDGALIVTGSYEGEIIAWDTKEGTISQTCKGHSGSIYGLYFIQNETHLISISYDTTIKIWNISSGDCVATIKTGDKLWCGVMNPTNTRLYTGSNAATIKEWCNISRFSQVPNQFQFQEILILSSKRKCHL